MQNEERKLSLSPGEQRQRLKSGKSQSSTRSPPRIVIQNDDDVENDTNERQKSSSTKKSKETIKRSESATSNRSTTSSTPQQRRRSVKTPTSRSKSHSPLQKPDRQKVKSSSSRTSAKSIKRKKSSSIENNVLKQDDTDPKDPYTKNLSGKGLSVLSSETLEATSLRRLILSSNNLACLPPNICDLINLEYLDFSRNPLRVKNGVDDYTCLPKEFRYLKKLKTLILAECNLKHIPPVVWLTISIENLDLSRNKVGFIVGELGNLTELRHLRLAQMDLTTLPPEIGFCDKILRIDLTGNPIDNIPETLVECRQMYEFKINFKTFHKLLDNYMESLITDGKIRSEHIPPVIFELENLQYLDLDNTKLNFIQSEHTLYALQELYLTNNYFYDIPEALTTMSQLKLLNMNNNRIGKIPDYIIKIKNLEILSLANNYLTCLTGNLAQLENLKKIIVKKNQITKIEVTLNESKSLLVLDVSYNQLTDIPDQLCSIEQLETFDIRYNQLETLPLCIRQMKSLQSMHTFNDRFQRTGLHLLGNNIIEPPKQYWKSTDIQRLYNYTDNKKKLISKYYYHMKLIIIGTKNVGKSRLIQSLINNKTLLISTNQTIDNNEPQYEHDQQQKYEKFVIKSEISSSITDQWIDQQIIAPPIEKQEKQRRTLPPLRSYKSNRKQTFLHKYTTITKNNCYLTIFDIQSEPIYEIIYPLIYDSKAFYLIPINLTILLNILSAAVDLDNKSLNDSTDPDIIQDLNETYFDTLITNDWLKNNITRYIESISNHCGQIHLAIIGLIYETTTTTYNKEQVKRLFDSVQNKTEMYLLEHYDDSQNMVEFYSNYFQPIYFNDSPSITNDLIIQLEIIAKKWNNIHEKNKRLNFKRKLNIFNQKNIIIDYNHCRKKFDNKYIQVVDNKTSFDEDEQSSEDIDKENDEENESDPIEFDSCLEFLRLTGDIVWIDKQKTIEKFYHYKTTSSIQYNNIFLTF
ncbi:unnamed protein product [Didymodactylos carnosus]|uniref:Leucine-rich repeat-containing protein n=2 Tax=Didymodactylos carnosus TaxID=1234261 RepID=A0A814FXA5_9BILA|nr:unnamed protein product [Didymodactylos carnosus]CAF3761003.1 unnamed protein product [Didymodactylos carnosus]